MSAALFDAAARWIAHDPDPASVAELTELVARAKTDEAALRELGERFAGPLEFGTAGLRGLLGAGESRMNRAVVIRTTRGLGEVLVRDAAGAKERGVVIGYDARRMSRELAEETARVLAAIGVRALLSPRLCPTPLTAFAVLDRGAVAGVMVTASHNPPLYNGYKVYWGNGAQIIPPVDKAIAAAIAAAPDAKHVPRMELDEARARGLVVDLGEDVERRYLDGVRALSVRPGGDRALKIAYTPLHGVGDRPTRTALREAGFSDVASVAAQAEPDGAFPTVAFPNPEEKGALDLALELARREDRPLVLANDPDVDRLAAAVRAKDGRYVQLTGNQVGVLLGHYVMTEGDPKGDRFVIATVVSSPELGGIARALGVGYEETLTGFKWIANRALEVERERGARFVFGYEEALGYTVGTLVRDKDGIGAAVVLAELAAHLAAKGESLLDRLEAIARRFGLWVSGQRSITMTGKDGAARIGAAMERLRSTPPARLGGLPVVARRDYAARVRIEGDRREPLALPPSDVLAFELEGGSRAVARPSGTEPKIKLYVDVREGIGEGEAASAAEARAKATLAVLTDDFARAAGL